MLGVFFFPYTISFFLFECDPKYFLECSKRTFTWKRHTHSWIIILVSLSLLSPLPVFAIRFRSPLALSLSGPLSPACLSLSLPVLFPLQGPEDLAPHPLSTGPPLSSAVLLPEHTSSVSPALYLLASLSFPSLTPSPALFTLTFPLTATTNIVRDAVTPDGWVETMQIQKWFWRILAY